MTGKRVLMVESDEIFLKACKVLLKSDGYEVETAPDIKSVRELDFSRPPDVIMLDTMLPDGSGLELCRELRKTFNIPILLMSALDDSSDVVAGLNAGADVYITKPVEFPVLKAHVEAALRRSVRESGTPVSTTPGVKIRSRPRQGPYFFPDRLKKQLDKIPHYHLTLVEAPSGYGKTTAVREYLRNNLPEGARENWYTCLGEPPKDAWTGICRLFSGFGEDEKESKLNSDEAGRESPLGDTARRLSELFPLTIESPPDIAALMREYSCETETYLVIDNYQLFESGITNEIINAFSVHYAKELHIIVITQPLTVSGNNVHNANICKIGARDFFFDRESTARLCRLSGAKLSEEELDKVQGSSEGWVAAIKLHAANYKESGSFVTMSDIDDLIETAIWNRMSGAERDFLISISLLNGFTAKQAAMIGGWVDLPESITYLLESNFFIPYVADKGVYSIHSLLRDYLLKRFSSQPSVLTETMNRRAGRACEAVSDYFQAARFFMKTGDYDEILSMPFTPHYLFNQEEMESSIFPEHLIFIERFIEECPEDILRKYPFTVLIFAYQFLTINKYELFSRMICLLQDICENEERGNILPKDELNRLRGEVALILSLTVFNDIAKMSAYHGEALNLLEGNPSSAISKLTPWTFGVTSVLFLFWSSAGELDMECALMDECLPVYSRITNGHGVGADSVFRAEASLMRGDDAQAEAACHKAIYQARGEQQTSICLCAELVLGRVAIMRGDGASYEAVRDRITKNMKEANQRSILRMGELCLASFDMMLGGTSGLPDWLRDADSIRRVMNAQGYSYAFMLHSMMLLLEGRRAKLYGLTDPLLNMAREMNYILPQVYQRIYLAVAKKNEGNYELAAEHLRDALNLALPDRMYLPFAEFGAALLPLLEKAKNEKKGFDTEEMNDVITLCKRFSLGVASITRQNVKKQTILTPREREIALLARDRFSTREIARKLFISENTVNSVLRVIYNKLEIHSKAELTKKEF